ncbi:VOC family protein [Bdellovibrio svalbardensis]|uniref:VOC family protein n=1 Tax=Bdellovibrio svalbardensis TaxID=2972972 RepID=A0ABT6DL46_9BACT|nr:VOC family protein [Bdellovibrio svalbardensis]MDG0817590.1 VOC family protein [Bdellovibrio svalbardensis]
MDVNGVGGIFIKAKNPEKLYTWYEKNLGLQRDDKGGFIIPVERLLPDYTLVSFLPVDTSYFSPSQAPCMLNFQVNDLAPVLTKLAENGVRIEDHLSESEYGKFAWVFDPEGNKIEFWEPRPLFYNPIDIGEPD